MRAPSRPPCSSSSPPKLNGRPVGQSGEVIEPAGSSRDGIAVDPRAGQVRSPPSSVSSSKSSMSSSSPSYSSSKSPSNSSSSRSPSSSSRSSSSKSSSSSSSSSP